MENCLRIGGALRISSIVVILVKWISQNRNIEAVTHHGSNLRYKVRRTQTACLLVNPCIEAVGRYPVLKELSQGKIDSDLPSHPSGCRCGTYRYSAAILFASVLRCYTWCVALLCFRQHYVLNIWLKDVSVTGKMFQWYSNGLSWLSILFAVKNELVANTEDKINRTEKHLNFHNRNNGYEIESRSPRLRCFLSLYNMVCSNEDLCSFEYRSN